MNQKVEVVILVEGKADKTFIEQYLKFLELENAEIKLLKGNLDNKEAAFAERIKQSKAEGNTKVIAIVDSDNEEHRSKIESILKKYQFDRENVFMFPDNSELGDLETLLKEICVKKEFFDCFDKYRECLRDNKLQSLDLKTEIYAYDCAVGGKGREEQRKYNIGNNYNLESPALKPLKKFLKEQIPKKQLIEKN